MCGIVQSRILSIMVNYKNSIVLFYIALAILFFNCHCMDKYGISTIADTQSAVKYPKKLDGNYPEFLYSNIIM